MLLPFSNLLVSLPTWLQALPIQIVMVVAVPAVRAQVSGPKSCLFFIGGLIDGRSN